jgi:hypothetical protein
VTLGALRAYVAEVRDAAFPATQHTYPMPQAELELLKGFVSRDPARRS